MTIQLNADNIKTKREEIKHEIHVLATLFRDYFAFNPDLKQRDQLLDAAREIRYLIAKL